MSKWSLLVLWVSVAVAVAGSMYAVCALLAYRARLKFLEKVLRDKPELLKTLPSLVAPPRPTRVISIQLGRGAKDEPPKP